MTPARGSKGARRPAYCKLPQLPVGVAASDLRVLGRLRRAELMTRRPSVLAQSPFVSPQMSSWAISAFDATDRIDMACSLCCVRGLQKEQRMALFRRAERSLLPAIRPWQSDAQDLREVRSHMADGGFAGAHRTIAGVGLADRFEIMWDVADDVPYVWARDFTQDHPTML